MFAYVAGALGNCSLIKQEDGGGICLVTDDKVKIPDYRIILRDAETFLVEVKNCSDTKIFFKEDYIEGLKNYASLNKCPLKIAVYWSRGKIWSLVSPDWFVFNNNRCELNIGQAIAMSEMAKLNDRMVATTPPLALRLLMDETKTSIIDDKGNCLFSIGSVQMFCAGRQIVDKIEKDIAFQLILSAQWKEEENVEIVENKVAYIEYKYAPIETNEEQGFSMIGYLSSIISEKFNSSTVHKKKIERLAPQCDPEQFEVFIPDDYQGKVLPLWRFTIQPNKDYKPK